MDLLLIIFLQTAPHRRSPNLRDLLVNNYPLSQTIIFRQAPSAVDKIVPLVHTLIRVLRVTLFTLQVKHAPSLASHITCNAKYVIYMVQCKRCNLQYIGATKRRLTDRFNEHRRAVDKTNISLRSKRFRAV